MVYFSSISETGFTEGFLDLDIVTVSTTSYDEEAIRDTIVATGKEKELLAAAIQLATVGWGKGNYGTVKLDGNNMAVETIFVEAGVFYGNDEGAVLEPGDLTPKRLCRYYRFHISQWMKEKKLQGYLVRKYGSRKSRQYSNVIFPGAEYLVSDQASCQALLDCYAQLDKRQHTNFVTRILIIYQSRGLEFEETE